MASGFKVLVVDLEKGTGKRIEFGDRVRDLGGSGLAAALYGAFVLPDAEPFDPRQPLIFAIGPLTGWFPLMSKAVCAFKSPYHGHYAESHAGGRLALAMRFSDIDALVLTGRARSHSALVVGSKVCEVKDVHYLWGQDCFSVGKWLRKVHPGESGHRSIMRIGPAGENLSAYACINVDTYRHFGRLGAGAVMGAKNLKAVITLGDGNFDLPAGKEREYAAVFKEIYTDMTGSGMMRKYHDLGTPENLWVLNKLQALPWNNLQKTSDEAIAEVSGEKFAEQLLLRKTACSGCPVGCIHIGLLRERFASENEYLYRQVAYDYEPIFSCGTMLGMKKAGDVLAVMDEVERVGLDVISAGVALAWASEALERGVISVEETLVQMRWGEAGGFREAVQHLGKGTNDFYKALAQGALHAAKIYGGEDFACVLGQEMAGYATGETYFAAQADGLRHSHLDAGAYSYDQKSTTKNAADAVAFLMDDEHKRVLITCMVACLFSRQVYSIERIQKALSVIGHEDVAASLVESARGVQANRWRMKFKSGFDFASVKIPKRYLEVQTWKGGVDPVYLEELRREYQGAIRKLAGEGQAG